MNALKDSGVFVPGLWVAFAFLCWRVSAHFFGDLYKDTPARGRWVARIRHDRFALRYRAFLDAGLNGLDRRLSREYSQAPTDARAHRKTEAGRAWSFRLWNLCLLFAVAYPVMSLLVQWTWTGAAGRLGTLSVMIAHAVWWERSLFWIFFCAAIVFGLSARRTRSRRKRLAFQVLAIILVYAFSMAGSFAVVRGAELSLGGVGVFAAATSVTFTLVCALAFSLTSAAAIAVALAVATASAILFSGTVDADMVSEGVEGAIHLVVNSGVAAVAITLACVFALNRLNERFSVARVSLSCFALYFCVVVFLTRVIGAEGAGIPLFFGVLPILNALADFASVGLTRWRLRWGVQGHLVFNAMIDGVAAVFILLALAFSIIAVGYLVPAGAPLIDFPALFADLRGEARGQYWWLGVMLFSTLLPTLIHLSIGAFALFTLVSGRIGRPIADGLMKGEGPEGKWAVTMLTLSAALAVWLPCFLLWQGLAFGGGWLLGGVLDACEWFYGWLSASFLKET